MIWVLLDDKEWLNERRCSSNLDKRSSNFRNSFLVYNYLYNMKLLELLVEIESEKPYQEEEDSTFTHDDKEYSVNKLLKHSFKTEVKDVPVSKLKWVLKYSDLVKKRIKNADYSVPIVIIKWEDKLVVLDGAHRLQKSIDDNKKTIPSKQITQKILDKCIVSSSS